MRILLINGNTSQEITDRVAAEAARVGSAGTEISAVTADFGAPLVLTRTESTIAAHAIVTALARHHEGCDAAVIAISTDAGLAAARECSPVPVVGMTEASLLTACMVGGKFGLLVFDKRALPVFREVVAFHGMTDRMAASLAVEMTPADFMEPPRIAGAILAGIERLVADAGAESVVVTGATMAGIARELQGRSPVPLLDGISCGVLQAELLVRLRLPKPKAGSYVAQGSPEVRGIDAALARLLAPKV